VENRTRKKENNNLFPEIIESTQDHLAERLESIEGANN
jgi:hypothetical protein